MAFLFSERLDSKASSLLVYIQHESTLIMQTPGQDVFRAILRIYAGVIKPEHSGMGVTLEWDLLEEELRGTFKIPIQMKVDRDTGEYIVSAQDFVSDRPTSP